VRIIALKTIAAAAVIALAAPAFAEVPPAAPVAADSAPADQIAADTVRLSPDQREAALEYGASRSSRELPINGLGRQIHGEVGMEIGSNGSHAIFGTATVPLGDSGSATISFLNANGGRYRYR
jgi:hypothetical protein